MAESKSPVDVVTKADENDKSASNVEAEQKDKEKYESQPEGKVKLGDYLVRIHNQSLAKAKLISIRRAADFLICNKMGLCTIVFWIFCLHRGRNS
jgi:hypothetical protein